MKRRSFLVGGAAGSSLGVLAARATPGSGTASAGWRAFAADAVAGLEPLAQFQAKGGLWTVYERRDGQVGTLWFVSPDRRMLGLPRRLEACGAGDTPFYAGLDFKTVALSGPDLLADHLLAHGDDPDPEAVRLIAPPVASRPVAADQGARLLWTFFLGTRQGSDTMPVTPAGSTRNWHVNQAVPGLTNDASMVARRLEGLLDGWMPALVKVLPIDAHRFWEVMLFADVRTNGPPVTPTFQRVCLIENGAVTETRFFGSYPAFGPPDDPIAGPPTASVFYAALLAFVLSWQADLAGGTACTLPDPSWSDMARHAFARELMTRPGGVYPRYGAVDRDYAGSEYDGFQDTFTSSLLANLEWGRFGQAHDVLVEYLSDFVLDNGLVRMRGTEIGQTGLGLSLIARYGLLTGDMQTLRRFRVRLAAMAGMLATLHERSLALPGSDPGYGLLAGWSESDSCLFADPSVWWKPYFGNSALAARGLADLGALWPRIDPSGAATGAAWVSRSAALVRQLDTTLRRSVRHDLDPPYVPILPGRSETFRESLTRHTPSEQQWPHRVYAELLQAGVLAPDLENLVIDAMRGHGATSVGVVANIGPPDAQSRDLLGFISYGYASALLRQDRIPEYLLFLYAHRHHLHTPGSWTSAEVAGLKGELPLFCMPAQLTIPILLRWMLVCEDETEEVLHLGRALPRDWAMSPAGVSIVGAATRWGSVNFTLRTDPVSHLMTADILMPPNARCGVRLVLRHDKAFGMRALDVVGAVATPVVTAPGATRDGSVIMLRGQPGNSGHISVSARLYRL
ncbi:MAG: hypothetical protein ACRYGI_07665 [Janthinobacterium lividum]